MDQFKRKGLGLANIGESLGSKAYFAPHERILLNALIIDDK